MANGNGHKKTFIEQYNQAIFGIACTLVSWVYFRQELYPLAHTTQVVALETQVKQNDAKTAAAVTQVKKQTSEAAGSAVVAQVAAQQAQDAAQQLAAHHREFMSKRAKQQINDLDMRVRSLTRQVQTITDEQKALEQRR